MSEKCPAVATFGIYETGHGIAQCRADLAAGFVVHVVSKSGGPRGGHARHRAWITLQPDPGAELTRVESVNSFLKGMSGWLDRAEESGRTLEVFDVKAGAVAFYVSWAPPLVLARSPGVLAFHTTSRTGRLILRAFPDPVSVQAVKAL